MQIAVPRKRGETNGLLLKSTLLSTSTLTVMAGATIAPSLPAMREVFAELPNADFLVGLVLTLPALFIAISSPFVGMVIDRFGRKRLVLIAIALYGLSGGAGVMAPTLILLLAARAILGLAVAGIRTGGTTLIADYFSGAERAQMMGLQAAFAGLGGTIFITLGGYLADIHWRGPFFIYLLAFVVLPFAAWVLYEPLPEPTTTASAVAAPDVQLPVGLMIFIYAIIALTQIVFYVIPVQLPFYLVDLFDATSSQIGLAIAATALFYAIASFSFGFFGRRIKRVLLIAIGFGITGIGYILIGTATNWVGVILGLTLGGYGLGLLIPSLNLWLADAVPVALRGRALGGFTTALFLGQFLSPFISQPLSTVVGIGRTYDVVGGALLVLVVGLFFLRHRIARLERI